MHKQTYFSPTYKRTKARTHQHTKTPNMRYSHPSRSSRLPTSDFPLPTSQEGPMHLGAIFPQNEFGNDPVAIRDWIQTAEGLGYDHVLAYDHVLGADPTNRPGWTGYNHNDPFHE